MMSTFTSDQIEGRAFEIYADIYGTGIGFGNDQSIAQRCRRLAARQLELERQDEAGRARLERKANEL